MFEIIDDFLPQEVIDQFRERSLSETYVNARFVGGYNSFDIYSDTISPLLIDYFRDKIPILRDKIFTRGWSFIYDNVCDGVNPHADPSSINVNIWITPDDCVEDLNKNGLIVYDKKAPDDMPYEKYNNDYQFIVNYLKDSKYAIVPYKYNRAVDFSGKTFHATNKVHMKPGHNNKRINYTFLFD